MYLSLLQALAVTVSFDSTALLSWYSAKDGVNNTATIGLGGAASGKSGTATAKAPTPPWGLKSTAAKPSDLVTQVLNGHHFFDPSSAKLDVQGASTTVNTDYRNLFALYQGVSTLEQLTEQASASGIGATQLASLQSAFNAGMSQLKTYLDQTKFSNFSVAEGTVAASLSTKVTKPIEQDSYQTGVVFTGDLNSPVPSLSGDAAFTLNVNKVSGEKIAVNFDLSEMGSTPRTLPDVINYLNGKLKAAGLTTRFSDVRIPAQPQTITSGGKTYTTPAGADSFALKITGTTSEPLAFSASDATPAVYLLQTSGTTTPKTTLTAKGLTTTPPDAVQQLTKLNADPTAAGAPDQVFSNTLPAQTVGAAVQATGPDGSLYVVSNVTGHAADGQTIEGAQDVVLTKYDSTGKAVYTRTLGAAGSATGYAVTVSPDGKSVAVAGSVTGSLDSKDGTITQSQADTFVSVYKAASGDESWTTRAGTPSGDDHPTGVAFDSKGGVYITGVTSGRFNGQTQTGTQDGFVQAFSSTGVAKGAQEFGATGINTTTGIVVNSSGAFVASQEDGHAVLRSFNVSSSGALTAAATRDLGALNGGNLAGITTDASGNLILAGSTHNGALAAGTVTTAYSGGRETFVARLAANGVASGSDQLSYYNPGGDATATTVTAANGLVYVAGQVTGAPTSNSNGQASNQAYVAAIDPTTGQAVWSDQINGIDGQNQPTSVAVGATGASVLDAFGLPQGAINYVPSVNLVDNSALRPGDQFGIQIGTGAPINVTITADDTLDTLAEKIQLASGYNATAKLTYTSNGYKLTVAPANSRTQVTLVAGASGKDALGPLGLTPGLITGSATSSATISKTSSIKVKPYSLGLSSTLNLNNANAIKQAQAALLSAQSTLKSIFTDMTTAPPPVTPAGTSANSGKVPAYVTAQIANYKAGLARLTGGG